MDRRTFVTTVGVTVAGVGIAGCGDPGPGADTTEDDGDDGVGDGEGVGDGVGDTPGAESPAGGLPGEGTETTEEGVFGDETTTEGAGTETTTAEGTETGTDDGDMVDGTPGEVETETPGAGTETGTPGAETETPGEGAGDETPAGGEGQDVSGIVGQIESGLQVESHDFLESWDGGAVVGNILNRGRSTYSSIDLEVELYDEEGSTITTMSASSGEEIDDLAPQESWRFIVEHEGDVSEVTEYELNVTAQSASGGTPAGEGTETTGGTGTETPAGGGN